MILAIRSNHPSFKSVEFDKGFNIVIADRVLDTANQKLKSRNGAGKTTLIEIMHFCLGAKVGKDSVFKSIDLKGWSFTLDIEIDSEKYSFERSTDDASKIYVVEGNIDGIDEDYKYDKKRDAYYFSLSKFNKSMQRKMYGLESNQDDIKSPSFRELISYVIRRGSDGFASPFLFFSKQTESSKQICNAFFLNLNVSYAEEFQRIKDKKKGIKDYKQAAKTGVLGDLSLNIGELSTEVFRRQKEVDELAKQLEMFKVLPQYKEITHEANLCTTQMHELSNKLLIQQRLINRYEEAIRTETIDVSTEDIKSIYEEAGIFFSERLNKSLDDVLFFHQQILANRKSYLQSELERLKQSKSEIESTIESLDSHRSDLMKVLESHGALEEYSMLQDRYNELRSLLKDAKNKLSTIQYIEDSKSRLEIENQELLIKSRQDYNERMYLREEAVSLFKANTEYLYPHAGKLTVDIKETGYSFNIDIKNSRSQGVGYMTLFCYDMMIAELGKKKEKYPDFIVHDSTVFDGVDERQVARALMLAMNKCSELGIQYIGLINSDMIPYNEFDNKSKEFFDESIRLRISDEQENGGLLGIRF